MRCALSLIVLLTLLPVELLAQAGDGRIYVRRIEFVGTNDVDDDVLRQAVTQLEGTFVNTTELERSRIRLERLPFVARAEIAQRPVDGAPDQVDVLINITEAPAREYRVGGAWSESQRLSGYGYFVNENFLGTGQRVFAQVEASEFYRALQLSHTDRFVGTSDVSRTLELSLRSFDQLTADTTALEGDLARLGLSYSYRIAERQSVRLGLVLQDAELNTGSIVSSQLDEWIRSNGNPSVSPNGASTDYLLGEFQLGWHHDTRNRSVFPDTGLEQRARLRLVVPGSEVEYFAFDYELNKYWTLGAGWTARFGAELGYGEEYGSSTTSLPPNLHWFAGGANTVRGYRENRLGPKDSLGNPYGGNLFLASQFELMMPLPEKWQENLRLGFFYDVGNTFSTEDIDFVDDAGNSLDYGFDVSELRHSAGIAARVRLPIGILRLSYGIPLNADDDNPNRFLRDDVERFQIAIGVGF